MSESTTAIEKMITASDVAELLSLSTHSVLDMAQDGRLPSYKIGHAVRFRESELAAWIAERHRPARRIAARTAL